MTKRDLPLDLRTTMELFAEAQLERVSEMSSEELDEALRSQGLDPKEPFDVEELLAKLPPEDDATASPPVSPPPAPVVPLAPKRRSRLRSLAWIALPAAAAVLVALEVPTSPRASSLREEATKACDERRWTECARSLDEARELDPSGESQERVVKLREAIARSAEPKTPLPAPPEPARESPPLEAKPKIPRNRP